MAVLVLGIILLLIMLWSVLFDVYAFAYRGDDDAALAAVCDITWTVL